jgi:hypothetical protein
VTSGSERGNRTRVPVNRIKHLQAKQVPQRCLTHFRLISKPAIEQLVLDYRKRQQSRAQVRVAIETVLDQGLPDAYTPELYEQKAEALFQHVFEWYYGAGKSVYEAAA